MGAVIYTHSHSDHFGGVKGVISEADVAAGKVQVLAPSGFMEAAVAENILAGTAMSRRAHYQFGVLLPSGPRGQVDTGLGKAAGGRHHHADRAHRAPSSKTTEERTIDGVEIVFQLVPGSEAPAEMLMYFPQFSACSTWRRTRRHTMHNLYTIRGAEMRDGNAVVALHRASAHRALRRQDRHR